MEQWDRQECLPKLREVTEWLLRVSLRKVKWGVTRWLGWLCLFEGRMRWHNSIRLINSWEHKLFHICESASISHTQICLFKQISGCKILTSFQPSTCQLIVARHEHKFLALQIHVGLCRSIVLCFMSHKRKEKVWIPKFLIGSSDRDITHRKVWKRNGIAFLALRLIGACSACIPKATMPRTLILKMGIPSKIANWHFPLFVVLSNFPSGRWGWLHELRRCNPHWLR